MHIRSWQRGRDFIVYDGEQLDEPSLQLFDAAWWQSRGLTLGQFRGRGAVDVVQHGNAQWVLRSFRRGGVVGRVADHSYVWTGLERSRPWREWRVLAALHDLGLPVPRPVAAHVRRTDLRYQGHILSELIPDAVPLSAVLQQQALPAAEWRVIGRMIRTFHDAGVHHPDLNASNILRRNGEQHFVVDFDKARLGAGRAQLRADLQRLRRSFDKHRQLNAAFRFDADCWQAFNAGYCG